MDYLRQERAKKIMVKGKDTRLDRNFVRRKDVNCQRGENVCLLLLFRLSGAGRLRECACVCTTACYAHPRMYQNTCQDELNEPANSIDLCRLITDILRPPSSSIIRPWIPSKDKVLVNTN
ncbi:hypothetical protein EVAR_77407_1 [Eumeta japonica]|uniref:Uncharacterized protein n=1 Tax=Eumeta variegata TaxID=151549 RepID=A0A4C1UX86_EUMVA|nr:hypothetical protein EVAR_77407_1 [Eumeta japonica]